MDSLLIVPIDEEFLILSQISLIAAVVLIIVIIFLLSSFVYII